MSRIGSVETTMEQFTLNPNLAYKVTDKWSVGAGMRFLYFDFEQYSLPVVTPYGPYGHRMRLVSPSPGASDLV